MEIHEAIPYQPVSFEERVDLFRSAARDLVIADHAYVLHNILLGERSEQTFSICEAVLEQRIKKLKVAEVERKVGLFGKTPEILKDLEAAQKARAGFDEEIERKIGNPESEYGNLHRSITSVVDRVTERYQENIS